MPPERAEAELPQPAPETIPALIQALLFVSDGPVAAAALTRALNASRREVDRALERLRESLRDGGLRLQVGPEGAQLITAPEAAPYVQQFLGLQAERRLSTAALETLAIVAFRQPATRATIESIRGVNSDGAVATLRARGLIDESGRAPGPGRPTLFVTTQRFLEHFGLERPEDLPPLGDLELPPPDSSAPLPETAPAADPPDGEGGAEAPDGSATPPQPPDAPPRMAGGSGDPPQEARPARPAPRRRPGVLSPGPPLPAARASLPRRPAGTPPAGGPALP